MLFHYSVTAARDVLVLPAAPYPRRIGINTCKLYLWLPSYDQETEAVIEEGPYVVLFQEKYLEPGDSFYIVKGGMSVEVLKESSKRLIHRMGVRDAMMQLELFDHLVGDPHHARILCNIPGENLVWNARGVYHEQPMTIDDVFGSSKKRVV